MPPTKQVPPREQLPAFPPMPPVPQMQQLEPFPPLPPVLQNQPLPTLTPLHPVLQPAFPPSPPLQPLPPLLPPPHVQLPHLPQFPPLPPHMYCSIYDSANVTLPQLDYTMADTYTVVAGSLVFLLILPFVLFQFKRVPIGTTAAILLGAILMVVTRVVSQDEFYAILGEKGKLRTIFLLLGMMIISQYFESQGITQNLLKRMLQAHTSFPNYLLRITLLTYLVSAVFTNDAACVVLTPVILKHWQSQKRPVAELETLLLAIATSSNIGSVITIFGNPQMALIASTTEHPMFIKSKLHFLRSLAYLGPPAVLVFFFNFVCLIGHSKFLRSKEETEQMDEKTSMLDSKESDSSESHTDHHPKARAFDRLLCIVLVAMVALFFVTDKFHLDIGLLPMAAAALIMTMDALLNKVNPNIIILKVDWGVILMFFSIFVWLGGMIATRVPRFIWKMIGLVGHPLTDAKSISILSAFIIFGSSLFSNVPLTILVLEQLEPCVNQLDLVLYLSWLSTIAGNLTLFGSVANLIVAQKGQETLNYRLTFWAHFKFGFVTTVVNCIFGIFVVYGLLQVSILF